MGEGTERRGRKKGTWKIKELETFYVCRLVGLHQGKEILAVVARVRDKNRSRLKTL